MTPQPSGASVPHENTGKQWSEMDDEDLRAALACGDSVPEIADFLCRPQPGVRARCKELGLTTLRQSLPTQPEGSIHLMARAWALRGIKC